MKRVIHISQRIICNPINLNPLKIEEKKKVVFIFRQRSDACLYNHMASLRYIRIIFCLVLLDFTQKFRIQGLKVQNSALQMIIYTKWVLLAHSNHADREGAGETVLRILHQKAFNSNGTHTNTSTNNKQQSCTNKQTKPNVIKWNADQDWEFV